MKKFFYSAAGALLLLSSCATQKGRLNSISEQETERIIRTLSADDMQGRATFTPGAEKAATFIETEFKKIGLAPLKGETGFRQSFTLFRIRPAITEVVLEGMKIAPENVLAVTDRSGINWNTDPAVELVAIKAGENFNERYLALSTANKQLIVFVDESFKAAFTTLRSRSLARPRTIAQPNDQNAVVFVMAAPGAKSFRVNITNQVEKMPPLFNVAGMIPGRSHPNEIVLFSGHYDHLGIHPGQADSIYNGADDDASGVTAMISLANYYKRHVKNERTLIFVAFTGEEVGGYGARYFSNQLNPDNVAAMFNIEMIGKDSKFGPNTAFITGFERSDFGPILQKNLEGTAFKFYPDPYPAQNLFYRSDNATLARLGVPAHTISTDQIDTDPYYHQATDEFKTLDVRNIIATIKAIALSSRSIVAGIDTPTRIPKQ